eukprot:5083794-Alexandrium_andersonii.AAC.1
MCIRDSPRFARSRNACRDALAGELREVGDADAVTTEQHVPGWGRMTDKGVEQAVLDVIVVGNSGRVAVGVSVAEAPSTDAAAGRARA